MSTDALPRDQLVKLDKLQSDMDNLYIYTDPQEKKKMKASKIAYQKMNEQTIEFESSVKEFTYEVGKFVSDFLSNPTDELNFLETRAAIQVEFHNTFNNEDLIGYLGALDTREDGLFKNQIEKISEINEGIRERIQDKRQTLETRTNATKRFVAIFESWLKIADTDLAIIDSKRSVVEIFTALRNQLESTDPSFQSDGADLACSLTILHLRIIIKYLLSAQVYGKNTLLAQILNFIKQYYSVIYGKSGSTKFNELHENGIHIYYFSYFILNSYAYYKDPTQYVELVDITQLFFITNIGDPHFSPSMAMIDSAKKLLSENPLPLMDLETLIAIKEDKNAFNSLSRVHQTYLNKLIRDRSTVMAKLGNFINLVRFSMPENDDDISSVTMNSDMIFPTYSIDLRNAQSAYEQVKALERRAKESKERTEKWELTKKRIHNARKRIRGPLGLVGTGLSWGAWGIFGLVRVTAKAVGFTVRGVGIAARGATNYSRRLLTRKDIQKPAATGGYKSRKKGYKTRKNDGHYV